MWQHLYCKDFILLTRLWWKSELLAKTAGCTSGCSLRWSNYLSYNSSGASRWCTPCVSYCMSLWGTCTQHVFLAVPAFSVAMLVHSGPYVPIWEDIKARLTMPNYPCNANPMLLRTLKSLDRNQTRKTSLTTTVMAVNNSVLWKKTQLF